MGLSRKVDTFRPSSPYKVLNQECVLSFDNGQEREFQSEDFVKLKFSRKKGVRYEIVSASKSMD